MHIYIYNLIKIGYHCITCDTEDVEDEEWILSHDDVPRIHRPLPISCPEFPEGGSHEEIEEWHMATSIAYEKAAKGCFSSLLHQISSRH